MKKVNLAKDILRKINERTNFAKKALSCVIASAKLAEIDADRTKRQDRRECKFCYYINIERESGRAIIPHNCELCRGPMFFASTVTNKICLSCAAKHHLCSFCMADVDLGQVSLKPTSKTKKKI